MKNRTLGIALTASFVLACLTAPLPSRAASASAASKRTTGNLAGRPAASRRIVRLHHVRRHVVRRRTAGKRLVSYTRRPRARHVWTSPTWYADPTLGDDISGEDPLIRQAAVSALGNLNGSVVVVDPNDGRILSIVNQRLALTGAYTPCSTIKPVVATAGLEEGIISPETRLRAEGRFVGYFGTARIDLAQALAESSNEYFAKVGQMLGYKRVAEYAHEFGLGERAGLDIPGESPGVFPSAPPRVGGVGLLTSFGQDIEMTPLQLAAVVTAIANGGTLYYLQYPRTPDEIADFQPRVRHQLDGSGPFLADVRQGMAASVLYGTSKLAFNPQEQIFGKTGTCSDNGMHLRWYAGFSGGAKPDKVVVVLLRGEGSMFGLHAPEVAGKVYRDLLANAKPDSQAHSLLPGAPGRVSW